MPLVPTRTGEAPLLAAYWRRWELTFMRFVFLALLLASPVIGVAEAMKDPTSVVTASIEDYKSCNDKAHSEAERLENSKEAMNRAEAGIVEDLRAELLEMGRRDQELRERPLPALNSPDIQPLIEEMTKIDQANFRRLEEIINEFGWPGKHLVGEEASSAAWLILQHADVEQQKRYLPALRSAVAKSEARASNLAMTEDRILVGEGKNQLYGTQIVSDPNGKPRLHPVDDPANLDERRKAVGLPPIDEYLKHAEAELGMKIGRGNLVEQ